MRIQASSILIALFTAFLVASSLIVFSNAASSSSTQGYVAYQVTLQRGANQTSFVLNESSVPTSQSGFVDLTFALTSNMQNLTYSHVVNSSSLPEIFPFVPAAIVGQTFSYETHGISINANITSDGSSSISFNGANYAGSKYLVDLSVTNPSSGKSLGVTGTMVTLPSDLLYSAELNETGNPAVSLSVRLLSTNLQLDPSSSVSSTQVAAIAGAGALGAAAFAIPLWKLRKKRNSAASSSTTNGSEAKPSYWVD
jgi:hypothetical protein